MFSFKTYSSLPDEAAAIRKAVFVDEQGFVDEFDGTDDAATHIVLYNDDEPIACCRFFAGAEAGAYVIGRFAVLKERRKQGAGTLLLKEAERQIREAGGKRITLAAQVRAKGFYAKAGYAARGGEFLEQDYPHVRMEKLLGDSRWLSAEFMPSFQF